MPIRDNDDELTEQPSKACPAFFFFRVVICCFMYLIFGVANLGKGTTFFSYSMHFYPIIFPPPKSCFLSPRKLFRHFRFRFAKTPPPNLYSLQAQAPPNIAKSFFLPEYFYLPFLCRFRNND